MDNAIADEIIKKELEFLQARPYADLSAMIGKPSTRTTVGRDGREYDIEVQVFWDGDPDADLRVIVSVSDGGWRAMLLRSDDVLIARDHSPVNRARFGVDGIRKLLRSWDPIGVFGDGPNEGAQDEYDSYASRVVAELQRGNDARRLSEVLSQIARDEMRITSDEARNLAAASGMVQWWNSLPSDD